MKKPTSETVKYIVEAAAPKAGEMASSGGIRSAGKIVSQFKNPIPYTEPSNVISNPIAQLGVTIGVGVLKIGVDQFLMPVVSEWCEEHKNRVVENKIKTNPKSTYHAELERLIQEATDADKDSYASTSEKKEATIIKFPNVG